MFNGAAVFNQDLSGWNVGNGQSFARMFNGAVAFNQDLSRWDVANGHSFERMFYRAATFNQDLSRWNVGNGQSFTNMFRYSGMNHFIGDWCFKSMGSDVGLSVFFSMLSVTKYPHDMWEQLNNLILVNCAKVRRNKV